MFRLVKTKNKRKKYVIKNVRKINIRYYMITINNNAYIIDFANPKDLRNYFSWIFLDTNKKWNIYNVTGYESNYDVKDMTVSMWLVPLILISSYILNVRFSPRYLNLRYLTRDIRIIQYWPLAIGFIFLLGFIFFMLFYTRKTEIQLPEQSKVLVRSYRLTQKRDIIFGQLMCLFAISGGLFVGIIDGNYLHLVVLGGGPLYTMLFVKFGNFLDIKRNRYYIIEKVEN